MDFVAIDFETATSKWTSICSMGICVVENNKVIETEDPTDTSKINIDQNTSNIELVYGLNEFFTNQVKMQSNQKLKLTIDDKENSETQIDFNFDDENSVLLDDIEIIANENTKSTIIIKYTSNEEIESFHNGIIRINAKQNSKVNTNSMI